MNSDNDQLSRRFCGGCISTIPSGRRDFTSRLPCRKSRDGGATTKTEDNAAGATVAKVGDECDEFLGENGKYFRYGFPAVEQLPDEDLAALAHMRDVVGYEYAKSNDVDLEEGDEHADWLLDEAARLVKSDELLL